MWRCLPWRYKWLLAAAVLAVHLSNELLDETTANQQFLAKTLWLEFILGMLCYEIHRRQLVPRVHIGDASYATYLSHMFVIGFIERIVFVRLDVDKDIGTALFTMVCCLVVGSLVYRLVDLPLTRWARAFGRRIVPARPAPLPRRSSGRQSQL